MRGLPPLPTDILTLRVGVVQGGSEFGFVQHIYSLNSSLWTASDFSNWISQWGTFAEVELLNMMPSSCSFTTCRLARAGTLPLTVEHPLPTNSGAHGQCSTLNAALCLTWRAFLPGSSARAHTRLPLPAEAVNEDKRTLIEDFRQNYILNADAYLLQVNQIQVTVDPPSELVVVSRSQFGVPRLASVFSAVVAGDVSRFVGTLQSRVR